MSTGRDDEGTVAAMSIPAKGLFVFRGVVIRLDHVDAVFASEVYRDKETGVPSLEIVFGGGQSIYVTGTLDEFCAFVVQCGAKA